MNNESILQNEILRKYKLELSKLITYLKKDLQHLEIKTALVYGSSTYNTKEMSLAAEWLKVHGHTDAEVLEFLDFIAQKPVKAEKPKEKE